MSWTDERVARLTKLWQDGLSASQIAAELGGVTRNAVIGKVHRLGMSGRDKPAGTGGRKAAPAGTVAGPGVAPKPSARRKSDTRRAGGSAGAGAAGVGGSSATARGGGGGGGGSVGNAALKMEMNQDAAVEMEVVEKAAEDVVVPISRKLDLLQLTETTCKWPTGDPTMPGFSFCGHTSAEDKPYCEFHSKLAFQPPSERRRRR